MKQLTPAWWLAAPAIAAAAFPVSAQVFSTKEQALRTVFGAEAEVREEVRTLTTEERKELEVASGLRFPEREYRIHTAVRNGKPAGYALVMDEIGKSEPVTFLVAVTPDFRVLDVVILVFRESRGWEVKEQRFTRQFRGKKPSDAFRVNQDIVNYTGATLSSKAVARGVKRAALLMEHFYGAGAAGAAVDGQALLAPGYAADNSHQPMYRQARYRMGTVCEVRLRCDSPAQARQAFTLVFGELTRLETVFSAYRPDSELAYVNANAARGPVRVSQDFWRLLKAAVRGWRNTQGAFDLTSGPLVRAWGFREGQPRVPAASELREALALTGSEKLRLRRPGKTVQFAMEGMELDFGGLAKGYGVTRILAQLRRMGITDALVNLGGSSLGALASRDVDAAGAPEWLVGVADPARPSQPAAWLDLPDGIVLSTSGSYEQAALVNGRPISHVIDPRSGAPLGATRSATVSTTSGVESEIWSKKFLLEGRSSRKPSGVDSLVLESGKEPRFHWNPRRSGIYAPVTADGSGLFSGLAT